MFWELKLKFIRAEAKKKSRARVVIECVRNFKGLTLGLYKKKRLSSVYKNHIKYYI